MKLSLLINKNDVLSREELNLATLDREEVVTGSKIFEATPEIVHLPTKNRDAVNKLYVDNLMGLNATPTVETYQGTYGISWNETLDTYTRVGANGYKSIQSRMKRCALNADGSVNYYLHPDDSTKKADGSLAVLDGTDGNVMVQIPKVYTRYTYTTTGGTGTDTVHKWELSLTPEAGFEVYWSHTRGPAAEERAFRYYPAYQGSYNGTSTLISRSGVYPKTSQTLAQFRTAARKNSLTDAVDGSTPNGYWGSIDFALCELITMFMIIEYGTMNIQSALGQGRTMLSAGGWSNGSYIGINGLSNYLGNGSGNYTYTGDADDAQADLSFMSYRGCENFFGNVWRMTDGVIFRNTTNAKTMWYSTNPIIFSADATGYTQVAGILTASASGYARKIGNTSKGFIPIDVTGGSSNVGTTDYYYTSSTDYTLPRVGGNADYALYSGPLNLLVADAAASLSAVNVGAGVCF